MARRFIRGELQNRSGDVLRGGYVNVYEYGTLTEVDLYAAESGGSPLTQPLTTDVSGWVQVWADDFGELDVLYSDSGAVYLPNGRLTSFDDFTVFEPSVASGGGGQPDRLGPRGLRARRAQPVRPDLRARQAQMVPPALRVRQGLQGRPERPGRRAPPGQTERPDRRVPLGR